MREGGEKEKAPVLEPASPLSNGCALANPAAALPGINPLSALQSVLNNHLGKATEPLRAPSCSSPSSSTMSMFHKPSLSVMDKPVLSPPSTRPFVSLWFRSRSQPPRSSPPAAGDPAPGAGLGLGHPRARSQAEGEGTPGRPLWPSLWT